MILWLQKGSFLIKFKFIKTWMETDGHNLNRQPKKESHWSRLFCLHPILFRNVWLQNGSFLGFVVFLWLT